MTETFLKQLTDEELLRYVNRESAEVRELAERLEAALEYSRILDPLEEKS